MKTTVSISAKVENVDENRIRLEIEIPLVRSHVQNEELIQHGLNAGGVLATQESLKLFDTDGTPIQIGTIKLTSKGQLEKTYQTPYGAAVIERHVYQSSEGGETHCPLERDARIIGSSTPKLAKMISHKYSRSSVDEVKSDFKSNHGRSLSKEYIQRISDLVGSFALAKEESWSYSTPKIEGNVATIAIGIDGTCMLMRNEGYRQAMVGTISLYDKKGERMHSTYVAATPEYGKETFLSRVEKEISDVKKSYPDVRYVGIADGAKDNWPFLKQHTSIQITDFYHASEYLTSASHAIFSRESERQKWLDEACHKLKHNKTGAQSLLRELKKHADRRLSSIKKEKLKKSISYFESQRPRMKYADMQQQNIPIGSGPTESACKVIVKQRLGRSGMKWKEKGAGIVLSLRCLDKSDRWEEFWGKIDQYGFSLAA